MSQISFNGVTVEIGGSVLLESVSFSIERGERWGVVGRNGTGKTTLLRVLTGELEPARGSVARASGLRMALLDQRRDFGDAATVWEAAAGRLAPLLALERSLAEQAQAIAERGADVPPAMLARYDRDLERFAREGGYALAARIDAVLHGLGFDPREARTRPLDGLSGGERGRLGLARQLVAPADILLLDEPTNHLDLETTRWLEEYLRSIDETVVLISHDRVFLDAVIDHVLHLEAGTATPYAASYSDFVRQRAERRLAQQRAFEQQQKRIAAEEEYIRRNIAGQNSRQAKGRRTRLARLPRLAPPPGEEGTMAPRLEAAERGGDRVLVAEELRVTAGERVLLDGFTARIERGEVVGLIGPNGAGKTTLLRTLLGERPAAGGSVRLGESIEAAIYRQDLSQAPMERTIFDVVHDLRPRWDRGRVHGHLGRYGFPGADTARPASTLSGGELARLALATLALSSRTSDGSCCANFLVLDEPTNHLDVDSIEALEDALADFDGTILLVSHDRALLRRLVDRVWVLRDGRITDYPGSFEEWEAASREREAVAERAAGEARAREREREREREKRRRREDGRHDARAALRRARRAMEEAEAAVARIEARIAEIQATLDDPDLYATIEGARRAKELARELEDARVALDDALETWARATENVEALSEAANP